MKTSRWTVRCTGFGKQEEAVVKKYTLTMFERKVYTIIKLQQSNRLDMWVEDALRSESGIFYVFTKFVWHSCFIVLTIGSEIVLPDDFNRNTFFLRNNFVVMEYLQSFFLGQFLIISELFIEFEGVRYHLRSMPKALGIF